MKVAVHPFVIATISGALFAAPLAAGQTTVAMAVLYDEGNQQCRHDVFVPLQTTLKAGEDALLFDVSNRGLPDGTKQPCGKKQQVILCAYLGGPTGEYENTPGIFDKCLATANSVNTVPPGDIDNTFDLASGQGDWLWCRAHARSDKASVKVWFETDPPAKCPKVLPPPPSGKPANKMHYHIIDIEIVPATAAK